LCAVALSATLQGDARAQDQSALAWRVLHEEVAIATLLDELRAGTRQRPYVLVRNVRLVDPVDRNVSEPSTIIVSTERGAIAAIVPLGGEPPGVNADTAQIVDGGGRFASPGLIDMHIHSESASSYLLNLANGVTTVREMDGFPWMLAARDAVNNGRMLGPTSYVAGTIINALPMDGYAVVASDTPTARRIVRQQAACGYDFIKVHNLAPQPIFDAIAEEARRAGMDLVGHVPHGMAVRHAAEQGMRTMEHLKGWLDDRTLRIGDQDYAAAASSNVWVTPTFYGYRAYVPADQRAAMLAAPAARYVPARVRAQWRAFALAEPDASFELNQSAYPLRLEIMRELIANNARFLVGTDAAGYTFHTMGFAPIEEMRLLRAAGVSVEQTLRAATSEPAAALRAEGVFGRLVRGARADFVLLEDNPLVDPMAYARNSGVLPRGAWLVRAALDNALTALAALYADGARVSIRPERLVADAERLAAGGFVFYPQALLNAAQAARRDNRAALADRLQRLAIAPTAPPCGAIAP